jgi:hypothetical protein
MPTMQLLSRPHTLLLVTVMFAGCQSATVRPVQNIAIRAKVSLSKCDRLQIWKDVLMASAFAKKTSAVLKHETGRDEYRSIYLEKLGPTLKRYGQEETEAFLIFEEEGGWPYD